MGTADRLQGILPFDLTKRTYLSYLEWDQYMKELVQTKKAQLASGDAELDTDLMSALVRGSQPSMSEKDNAPSLTEADVFGNAFIFILAGHETTANSMHFCSVYLAMNRSPQLELQADLDRILEGRPVASWDYDRDLPSLFGGMPGAVLAEELRLAPPVTSIPKMVTSDRPQTLMIDGKLCTLPADTFIGLCASSVHRNPHHWPAGSPADPAHPVHPTSNLDNDLEEFKPERWIIRDSVSSTKPVEHGNALAPENLPASADTADLGINTSADTAASLFKPRRGAYIPSAMASARASVVASPRSRSSPC